MHSKPPLCGFVKTLIATTACLGIFAGGCSAPVRSDVQLTQTLSASDPDTQMEFWHQLAEKPLATNDEAFHALILILEPEAAAPETYEKRVAFLKGRGLLKADFDRAADESVLRGTLAVAIAKHLKIRGGVMMMLTGGDSAHYATRELVFEGIYPPSSPGQTFSGSELVGVMGVLDDYATKANEKVLGKPVNETQDKAPATTTTTASGTQAGTEAASVQP